ncbi:MAG: U32 family peptidase [Anaerolineaceae bacterium]|nr:U32 family peptidase [Anaerolineaceae bacterium]
MDQIELLSPAKDLETGIAAINCGADAVYIGPSRYGARKAAGNSLQDIQQLIDYAHKYWASVYVTVNTLLYDEEIEAVERLIRQLYEIGADALIIQDVGLLELALPPIPLFASTQMHNHTPERIAFLEKVGFQRVIMARELSLSQIKDIRAATTIELEAFIHGSLCVSYSGQCYMSYAIGGRSANRGQCAQPCRRQYSLVDANNKSLTDQRFLLSLRDLNLSDSLADLIDAGVCSFKIEGRLKNKAYVMNVVGHYRQLLDEILVDRDKRASSSGTTNLGFSPNPLKTFNRGYTSYFLHGRGDIVAAPDSPKSIGEPLGKVSAVGKGVITLEKNAPLLSAGDGLCFFNEEIELKGTLVNAAEKNTIHVDQTREMIPGLKIYRNHDYAFLSRLSKSRPERKIQIKFQIESVADGIQLTAVDEDGCQVAVTVPFDRIVAKSPKKSLAIIDRQLRKLGGTEFACTQVEYQLDPVLFLPVSFLNKLRRTAAEQLTKTRAENRPQQQGGIVPNKVPFPKKELTFQGNVLNHKAAAFYRRHGVKAIESAAESKRDMTGRKIMTTKYCLRYQINACPRQKDAETAAEPWKLVDEQGIEYPLQFNCKACEMEVYFCRLPEKPDEKINE